MKKKTAITVDADILTKVDRAAGSGESRFAFIERVLRDHFRRQARAAANARDLEQLNRAAERLNREAADVLEYQAPWRDE